MNTVSGRVYVHVVKRDHKTFEILNYSVDCDRRCIDDFQLAVTDMDYVFGAYPTIMRNLKCDQAVRFYMNVGISYRKDYLGDIDADFFYTHINVVWKSRHKRITRAVRNTWYRSEK